MEATERFAEAARTLGFAPQIQRFPEGTRTAADAAAAVGCAVGQIVKSLVFVAGSQPILVLTSGSNRVDEAKVARLLEVPGLAKASPDQVRDSTGFAIGGTPPCGHVTPLPTIVDLDLLAHREVWAAAGTPDSCFPIDPQRLVAVTGGQVADVAR